MSRGERGERGEKGERGASFSYMDCPICPDLNRKIDKIYVALLGVDGMGLTEGIVHAIAQLQQSRRVESSWVNMFKPLITGIASAVVASAVTYFILMY
jgi:hypothetical protein